jgi:lysophospholipase L1-like esterase
MFVALSVLLLGAGCEDSSTPLDQIVAQHMTTASVDTPASDDVPGPAFDFGSNNTSIYVCLGDSITAEAGYPERLDAMLPAEARVYNEGGPGEESAAGVSRVGGVLRRYRPGYLLILYGANDIIHGVYREETVENLRKIIRSALAAHTLPIVATVTPQPRYDVSRLYRIMGLNDMIIAMAAEEGVPLVDLEARFEGAGFDLFPDGLHPNAAGAQIIATAFYEVIQGL